MRLGSEISGQPQHIMLDRRLHIGECIMAVISDRNWDYSSSATLAQGVLSGRLRGSELIH